MCKTANYLNWKQKHINEETAILGKLQKLESGRWIKKGYVRDVTSIR